MLMPRVALDDSDSLKDNCFRADGEATPRSASSWIVKVAYTGTTDVELASFIGTALLMSWRRLLVLRMGSDVIS